MRQCDSCVSPFRAEIDEMILAGWQNKEVHRYLLGKYPGQKVPSYYSICNHAKSHVRNEVRRAIEASKLREKKIEAEIKGSIEAIQLLKENLRMVAKMLQDVYASGVEDMKDKKSLLSLIGTANETINLLLKYQEKVDKKDMSDDEIFDRLMSCVYDFPPELVDKIVERWESYE